MKRSSFSSKQSTEHTPARPSATPEGASKNLLTSQTGAGGVSSIVAAEVARHNADFERNLKAAIEDIIAREVKVKVAEILNTRSAAEQVTDDEAPPVETVQHEGKEGLVQHEDAAGAPKGLKAGREVQHEDAEGASKSLAAGQAQKEEPRPKIGTPWQIMLALGALICPAFIIGGAVINDAGISYSGMAFLPLSWSCFVLLILCDPSNRGAEKYFAPLYVLAFASSTGTMTYVNIVRLNQDALTGITVSVALLLSAIGVLYFLLLARRKIGDFTRQDLKDFVYKGVFWNGLGSLTPIIYLTAESLKCFLENVEESDLVIADTCDGMYFPQTSICFMFVLFLAARLFFIPLSPSSFDSDAIARFEDIDLKLKSQALLFSYIFLSNLTLFALMGEGPLTPLIKTLHYSELGCVVLIFFIEMVSNLILNAGRRRRESQAAKADYIITSFRDNLGSLEMS